MARGGTTVRPDVDMLANASGEDLCLRPEHERACRRYHAQHGCEPPHQDAPPRADLEGAKFAVLEGGAGRKVGSGQFHISRAVTLIIPTILIPPHLSSSSHAAPEIVESTGIRSAGYDPTTEALLVICENGDAYRYAGVTKEIYENLITVPSRE